MPEIHWIGLVAAVAVLLNSAAAPVVGAPPAATSLDEGADEPSLSKLLASWTQRQSHVRSLVVRWTENHVDFKNSISRSKSANPADWVPADDSQYTGEYELTLSNDLSIYKYDGRRMQVRDRPEKSSYVPFKSFETFDGREGRSLRTVTIDDEIPVGVIQRENANPDARNAGHAPLAWFCRPAILEMGGFATDQLDLMATRLDHDGTECMVLFDESFSAHTQVWVAPSLDYNVVGVSVKAGNASDKSTWEIWVSYDRNAEGLIVPKSWVFDASTSEGDRLWHIESNIHELLLNVPIDEQQFQLTFPPKTLVHDLKQGTKYLVDPAGSPRPLSPMAVGRTYDQLVSGSAEIPANPRSTYSTVLITLNIVAIAIIALWLLYLRRRAGS
jgi:hypothetical protein